MADYDWFRRDYGPTPLEELGFADTHLHSLRYHKPCGQVFYIANEGDYDKASAHVERCDA